MKSNPILFIYIIGCIVMQISDNNFHSAFELFLVGLAFFFSIRENKIIQKSLDDHINISYKQNEEIKKLKQRLGEE